MKKLLLVLSIVGICAFGQSPPVTPAVSTVRGVGVPPGNTCNVPSQYGNQWFDIMTASDLYTCGNTGWVKHAGGGGAGGTPASPSGSIQFNNAGSFGGSADFTRDLVTGQIGIGKALIQGGTTLTQMLAALNGEIYPVAFSGNADDSSFGTVALVNGNNDWAPLYFLTSGGPPDAPTNSSNNDQPLTMNLGWYHNGWVGGEFLTGYITDVTANPSVDPGVGFQMVAHGPWQFIAPTVVRLNDQNSVDSTNLQLIAKQGGGQTGDLLRFVDVDTTTVLSRFLTDGSLYLGGSPLTPFQGLYVGPDESTLPAVLQDYTTPTGFLLVGTSGASTFGLEAVSDVGMYVAYSGNVSTTEPVGFELDPYASADGQKMFGYYFSGISGEGFDGLETYGFYVNASTAGGGTIDLQVAYWSAALTNATNNYYSWFDSRGVRRVKEDATFDSVGQAIEALYNPQFTKYTPGAANYERVILGQWNSNEAQIGTEAGGTGTLRRTALIGAGVDVQVGDVAQQFDLQKITASATTPGAGVAGLHIRAGTNAGTCRVTVNAGTSATEVTIIDNVGGGC